jgi:hypothetical protein
LVAGWVRENRLPYFYSVAQNLADFCGFSKRILKNACVLRQDHGYMAIKKLTFTLQGNSTGSNMNMGRSELGGFGW